MPFAKYAILPKTIAFNYHANKMPTKDYARNMAQCSLLINHYWPIRTIFSLKKSPIRSNSLGLSSPCNDGNMAHWGINSN